MQVHWIPNMPYPKSGWTLINFKSRSYNFQIRVIESQFSSHKFCHNSYLVNCKWLFTTFTQIHHFYSILTISQIKIISTNFPILTVHLCLRSGFLFFLLCQYFPTNKCGHNGWKSLPSFCNGLWTINIVSSREMTFWSYYQRYGFRVKIWSWEGIRCPKPPNPKVGFPSLCLMS